MSGESNRSTRASGRETCGIARVEGGAGDGNRTHVTSLEGWRTTIVLRPLVVARRGFEPLISGLKGRRPSPLDERAARTDSARKRWQFAEVRSRAPCARPATNERRASDYCRHFALRIRWWAARVSNPRPPACQAGALPAELAAPVGSRAEWTTYCRSGGSIHRPAHAPRRG